MVPRRRRPGRSSSGEGVSAGGAVEREPCVGERHIVGERFTDPPHRFTGAPVASSFLDLGGAKKNCGAGPAISCC